MIKQLFLPIIGVAVFIVLVGILVNNPQKLGFTVPSPTPILGEVKIDKKTVRVALADTPDKRTKGLSGTTLLAEDQGMLFVFESQDTYPSFWMKDMLIPIDIIWINDGKIAKIDKNIPSPVAGTPEASLKLYRPDKPVDYVLEVNAGFSDKNNLEVGDSAEGDSI